MAIPVLLILMGRLWRAEKMAAAGMKKNKKNRLHIGRLLIEFVYPTKKMSVVTSGKLSLTNKNIMDCKKIQKMAKAAVVTLSIGLVSFVAVSAQASSGETIVGLTYLGGGAGQLYTINSAAPAR